MTNDDIIALARSVRDGGHWNQLDIIRFATLVAVAERKACAEILDRNAEACNNNSMLRDVLMGNALAIRARSKA